MKGVACFARFHASQEWKACQRQIADEVEGFVAAELVGVTKRAVHDAVFGQNDGVFQRASADESHGAERLDITFKTKCAGAGKNVPEGLCVDDHFHLLLTNKRVGKIDVAANAKFIGGIDADLAAVFDNFHRLDNPQITALAAEIANAGLIDQLHEWFGGAIQNGNFDGIDIDEDVVYAAGIDGSEEVFRSGQEHAFFHQAGGVTDARDVLSMSFNGKIIEINATKDDARVCGSRNQTNFAADTRVETDTLDLDGLMNGSLEHGQQ